MLIVASEEAISRSVMTKTDLISPARGGYSHLLFCESDPYFASTSDQYFKSEAKQEGLCNLPSIFPVSGAETFIT